MSVALFKYDRDVHDPDAKLVFSRAIASQREYEIYFEPAIKELNIVCFQNGAEIRRKDLRIVNGEIDRLIVWLRENRSDEKGNYLMDRLSDLKPEINENLTTDDDVLHMC